MLSNDKLALIPFSEFDRIRGAAKGSGTQVSLFADMCRINTLYMISFAGSGHVGSSLSSLDIVSYLYLEKMNNAGSAGGDTYFSSKGHDVPGLYSVLIGMGLLPFENIHKLRRLDGLPGHPDVSVPHIATNTGSLGMGISKARGMALADALNGTRRNYYVLLGDGELQEGQFWESLQPTANRKIGNITAIVDHNKIQSDTLVSEVSDLGDLALRVESCGWAVDRCDGHDRQSIADALTRLESEDGKPKFLIADTVKAKGAGPMESADFKAEDRLYKYHSGAPPEDVYIESVSGLIKSVNARLEKTGQPQLEIQLVDRPKKTAPVNAQKLVEAYSDALVEQGGRNKNLVVLSADLALDTGLLKFEKEFPERFIECGIAEQDMVSQAGGLALRGMFPVVHSFACFLATRPNEQVFNNATEISRIMYCGSLAGLVPGGPGHSHQSIRDIAALSANPGLELIEPSCQAEVKMAVDYCVNRASGSTYLRLVSIPVETAFALPAAYEFTPGRGVDLTDGADAVVFGYGPVMLTEAVRAARSLAQRGIGVKVINLPWLNRVDDAWLNETVDGYKILVTLDNHYIEGGQGMFLRGRLTGFKGSVVTIGVEDTVAKCGGNDEVLRAHGMDAKTIATAITGNLA